jgi:hypothetical protein
MAFLMKNGIYTEGSPFSNISTKTPYCITEKQLNEQKKRVKKLVSNRFSFYFLIFPKLKGPFSIFTFFYAFYWQMKKNCNFIRCKVSFFSVLYF